MNWKFIFSLCLIYLFACNTMPNNDHLSIFRYNESNGVATLDPAFAKDKATIWVTSQIFSSLVKMDENLEVVPSIARDWNISDDGKQYTFFLKDEVLFHDHTIFKNGKGRKVIASDFTYSFNRLLSEELASPGDWILNHVAEFYHENDSIFVITLNNPFPPFLSLLSMQYCSVVPYELADLSGFRSHPIGTGPFKFQYWQEGSKLVLRKNPYYFETENGVSLPYLDAVSVTFVKDRQSEFLSFLQGEIDFMSGLDPSYKDEILDVDGNLNQKYSDKVNLESSPFLNTEYLGFLMDGDVEISTNVDLRRAINFAIDKKSMIKHLRNNRGTAASNGFVPLGLNNFPEEVVGYSYDLDTAKKLLAKAGFPSGKGLEEITLGTTDSYLDLCEFIQNELKEIGIKTKIEVNSSSTHREMVATSKLNFFRGSWIADYPDAENYLSLFYSKYDWNNGLNCTHFHDNLYDELYEQSVKEVNIEKRMLLYQKMDQMIIDNAVVVPLYYDQMLRFSHKNIKGIIGNSQNSLDLSRVIIE